MITQKLNVFLTLHSHLLPLKLAHSVHNGVCYSLIVPQSVYQTKAKACREYQNAYLPHNTCCQNLACVETRFFLYNLFQMVNVCMLSLACMIAVLASIFIQIKEIKKEQKNH